MNINVQSSKKKIFNKMVIGVKLKGVLHFCDHRYIVIYILVRNPNFFVDMYSSKLNDILKVR